MRAPDDAHARSQAYERAAGSKKERGIFYTPPHIVESMLALSLQPKIAQASYGELLTLRVLDPACGTGAFLTACFRMLLERALAYWRGQPDGPERRRALRRCGECEVLSPAASSELLTSCIFGIDRDGEALALAAASLQQMAGAKDRAIPLRGSNLLHANGLVEDRRVDPLAFQPRGAFASVLDSGGFDLCLANPPYVFGEWMRPAWKRYFAREYRHLGKQPDYYAAFLERCVTRFLRRGGSYAVIVPDAILAREQRTELRTLLLEEAPPRCIVHAGAVFAPAGRALTGVSCAILVGERGPSAAQDVRVLASRGAHLDEINRFTLGDVRADRWKRFLLSVAPHEWPIVRAMESTGRRFGDVLACGIARGEEIGKRDLQAHPSAQAPHEVIPGEAVHAYRVGEKRYYARSLSKPASLYAPPRVLVRKTGRRCIAASDESGVPALQSLYVLKIADPVLRRLAVAVLNSDLLNWYVAKTITAYKNVFPQLTQEEIAALPFPARTADPGELLARLESALPAEDGAAKAALERLVCDLFGVHAAAQTP